MNSNIIDNLTLENDFVIVPKMSYNKYGWKKDKIDERDRMFSVSFDGVLPRSFSLREQMPPVLNQGKLGSCTANGICNAILYCEMKEKIDQTEQTEQTEPGSTSDSTAFTYKPRSRLFLYYNERDMEGNVNEDSGAQIRDGIKSVNTTGVCFEDSWPYDITQFTEKPPANCYKEAKQHRVLKYERVNQSVEDIKHAIYSGFPIVFGFVVYDSIQKPSVSRSGIIPLPMNNNEKLGGHCVICCGWDDNRRLFEIMNSWGIEWGREGFGYMSYDYLSNPELSSDFWKISFVK
jgi:C1A family cysteine protease